MLWLCVFWSLWLLWFFRFLRFSIACGVVVCLIWRWWLPSCLGMVVCAGCLGGFLDFAVCFDFLWAVVISFSFRGFAWVWGLVLRFGWLGVWCLVGFVGCFDSG